MLTACGPRPAAVMPASTPAATSAPLSSVPLKESALVAEADSKSNTVLLAPVDPATGQNLANYAPVNFGPASPFSFSPDRKMLIFVSYPPKSSADNPQLHFLDLASWQDSILPLNQKPRIGWLSTWAISPDGRLFAMAEGDKQSRLLLADVSRHGIIAQATLNDMVSNMQFTADSSGLMIYGSKVDPNTQVILGAPTAELLSAKDLSTAWSMSLNDVRNGFEFNPGYQGSAFDPGAGSEYLPGVVFAPDADMLYIVHADVDRLTQVDFAKRSVVTLDIRPKLSWLEQLLTLSAGTAYAKGQDGITLQAGISPDGRTIYTIGTQNKLDKLSNGDLTFTQTALNLQAISASDGMQLFKSDATGTTLGLSSDGGSVFLEQQDDTGAVTGTTEVNALTGEVINQYKGVWLRSAHRMDGTPLLVSAVEGYTDPSVSVMSAFTPDHQLLGTWSASPNSDWVIMP